MATKKTGSARDKLVDAFMALLAERPFEDIGLNEVAARAGVSLADFRGEFGSTFDLFAAFAKQVDQKVLDGTDPDMRDEPARERLFDVLMKRLEVLSPHKAALKSLFRSARRSSALAMGLNRLGVRSMQWMLTAADIEANGPAGALRAQGLAFLFARVIDTFVDDEDPGLARTMAKLDRELANAGRLAPMVDFLSRFSPRATCQDLRERFRSRRRSTPAAEPDDGVIVT